MKGLMSLRRRGRVRWSRVRRRAAPIAALGGTLAVLVPTPAAQLAGCSVLLLLLALYAVVGWPARRRRNAERLAIALAVAGLVAGVSQLLGAPGHAGHLLIGAVATCGGLYWHRLAGTMPLVPGALVAAVQALIVWPTSGPAAALWSGVGLLGAVLIGGAIHALRFGSARAKAETARRLDVDTALEQSARSGLTTPISGEERVVRESRRSIDETSRRTIELLRAALRGRTAAMIWIDSRARTASVRVAETEGPDLDAGPHNDRAGILSRLWQQPDVSICNEISDDSDLLPWYGKHQPATHLVGVALRSEMAPLGYLVVERAAHQEPFAEADAIALRKAAAELSAVIAGERVLLDAHRVRQQMQVVIEAAKDLTAAASVDEVCRVGHALIRQVARTDEVVISLHDVERGSQRIAYARGSGLKDAVGDEFYQDGSLSWVALRRQHSLPLGGRLENADTPLFGDRFPRPHLRSVLLVPMTTGAGTLGVFGLGSRQANAYDASTRECVELLVRYVALALAGIHHRDRATQLAEQDERTGLLNRRAFEARARGALDRADRAGTLASLLLIEIRELPAINERFGPLFAEQVLRHVAEEIRATLRKTDHGARFGQETFSVLLEDTSPERAGMLSERLRESMERERFVVSGEEISITLLIGRASYVRGQQLSRLIADAARSLSAVRSRVRTAGDTHPYSEAPKVEPEAFAAATS